MLSLTPAPIYWISVVIFSLSYLALAWGGVPGLRIDRAGIALTGAAAMLAFGAISFDDAAASADAATIATLLGMMIVVGFVYRRELAMEVTKEQEQSPTFAIHRGLLAKMILVTLITITCFFCGFPIAIVALAAAGACLWDRIRPEKVYRDIDWPLP